MGEVFRLSYEKLMDPSEKIAPEQAESKVCRFTGRWNEFEKELILA